MKAGIIMTDNELRAELQIERRLRQTAEARVVDLQHRLAEANSRLAAVGPKYWPTLAGYAACEGMEAMP